jgi:RNA polymerase sigma-70 factor (ECF subfamily)
LARRSGEVRPEAARGAGDLPDEALFEAVRGGSETHFNALYERYFQRIYNFIYLRTRNHADAEELTQETFTVVFRSADAWSGRSSPLGWIYGIAKNTVYNHLRRARTHGERLEQAGPGALLSASPAWSCTPEEQLSLDRYVRAIGERLEGVSDWQAEVFFLRHVENLPIREISRRTDRSSDAIRSGLYRVKRLLVEAGESGAAPADA